MTSTAAPPIFEVQDLTVGLGGAIIQQQVSFRVAPGSIFAIMGGSGSGKTTLLKAMIGLLRPAAGSIRVGQEDYWAASEARRAEIDQGFGVLFQSGALWSSMTVAQNVALPLRMLSALDGASISLLADVKLALVGLQGAGGLMPAELSGGMIKRAGLARALALDPAILLLDEPSSGLDPVTAKRLDDLILELRDGFGMTVILVSHDLPSLFAICDDGVFLDSESRTVIAHGAPVTFRGVRVGSVTRIGVNINLGNLSARVPVYMEINPSTVTLVGYGGSSKQTYRRLILAGLESQLGMQSLVTGELRVDLDLKPNIHATYLGGNVDGDEIPSSPSSLQTLETEIADLPLKEIAQNANQTLVSIKRVTDALGPRVAPLLDSLKQTSDAAHGTMDAAHLAADHIDSLAIEGKQQLTDNGDALKGVLASSDRTVRDADTLITSLNEMTAPNSRIRDDLQSTTRDLAASASSLRTFSHEIERNPSDLLKRGKAP